MLGYLFDTSALSTYYHEQHKHHAITKAEIDRLPAATLQFVSPISLAEIEFGIKLAELQGANALAELRERLERIRAHARLPITHHTSQAYAHLRSSLASRVNVTKKGRPRWLEDWVDTASARKLQIDENDLWIAAQAFERDLTLLTLDGDFRAFSAVEPSLRVKVLVPDQP
jgi:predicted nucleic acid-binding protein